MDIRSIVVNVDLETAGSGSLSYAIDLAAQFDAELIGVAADEPNLAFVGVDVGAAATDFYVMAREEIEKRLLAAEQAFRAKVPATIRADWRAVVGNTVGWVLDNARCADVIVTGATLSPTYQERRRVDLGELVIGAGRPVIDVGKDATRCATGRIVIGWKDSREARRAVADALPLLQRGREISAVTVSEGERASELASLGDLKTWLARHGVNARTELLDNPQGYDDVLETTAALRAADLVVTGGYGHSRMREWLFGGVTRSLLRADALTRLFAN